MVDSWATKTTYPSSARPEGSEKGRCFQVSLAIDLGLLPKGRQSGLPREETGVSNEK